MHFKTAVAWIVPMLAAACGSSVPDATPDAAPATESLQMPPVQLAAGEETTMCVTMELPNDTPRMLVRAHSVIGAGSHHLIAYRMPPTTAVDPTPKPCMPFADVVGGAEPLILAESADAEVAYPEGVGLALASHQVVKIEEHFLNSGDAPIQGTGSVELELAEPREGIVQADLMFWGPMQFSIAPHAAGSADFFHLVDAGTNVFAVATHEHHFGTLATIELAPAAVPATGTEIYRNADWAHPPLRTFTPAMPFDGTQGMRVHCEWFNTSDQPLAFGLSAATDEMCFFWAYYYPSHGFQRCNEMGCL